VCDIDIKNAETAESEGNTNYKIISNIFYKSQAGTNDDGNSKINQDSHVISENIFGIENYNIYGVLDGHGMHYFNP
jgi:hypothetical protein